MNDAFFVAVTIKNDFVPDCRNGFGIKFLCKSIHDGFSVFVGIFKYVYLNKFARVQSNGNLFDDVIGNAVFSYLKNRFEFLRKSF